MNTEHTNQSRQAANAAFEQWWQRHGLTDPMDDEDRQYATASSWARRGYLAAMGLATIKESLTAEPQARLVNQQLLDALGKISRMTMSMYTSAGEAMSDAKRIAHEAIAAAEQTTLCASCARANVDCPIYPQQTASCVEHRPAAEQQAEPVAWHTNDPRVSSEHIEAIARVCKIIPSYTTVEYVARIVGFGHVLLADKSVQEAFVRANYHLLRTDAAQPPAVAVVPAYAYRYAAHVMENIRGASQWCDCPAFGIAEGWINETQGGTMLPACQTCNGKGMIGGLLPNGGGYDGQPCPDCSAPQVTAEDSSVVGGAVAVPKPHPYAGKRKGHPDGDFSYRCGSDYCRCAQ